MAICKKCGNTLKERAKFCGKCGENIPQKISLTKGNETENKGTSENTPQNTAQSAATQTT